MLHQRPSDHERRRQIIRTRTRRSQSNAAFKAATAAVAASASASAAASAAAAAADPRNGWNLTVVDRSRAPYHTLRIRLSQRIHRVSSIDWSDSHRASWNHLSGNDECERILTKNEKRGTRYDLLHDTVLYPRGGE
ncbi:hypothetical protein LZ554_007146 [Drepanopeziza brunnea f. sp. 'monogermtubi']|nr:hypothetical protein LZ554_007146 [Drepanopeziza brunnea f. sp. 'monogermtubi']